MKQLFRKLMLSLASFAMMFSLINPTPILAASETSLSAATGTNYDGEKIVNYARKWIGKIPYKWGGRDMNNPTSGLDCAGFVDFVFISLGYTDLNAKLWGQTYNITDVGMVGTEWWDALLTQKNVTYAGGSVSTVSTGNAKPGDVVIYYDQNGTTYHMGIYSGNGKLIHECESLTTGVVNNVTESSLDTCVEKHNVDLKSVRIYRIANSDPKWTSLSSTKIGTGKVSVDLSVTKTDDETNKLLSDVEFEFHRIIDGKDEVLGLKKTNENGVASINSTITKEFTEKSSTYKYISDWLGCSDEIKKVWLNAGYLDGTTTEKLNEIKKKADAEVQAKLDKDIQNFESQSITYYAIETNAKNKYWLNPENIQVSTTQNNSDNINWTMSNTRTKVTLNLYKIDADTQTNEAQGDATLSGAVYGLYAEKDILDPADQSVIYPADTKILEVTTDSNASATVQNLYLGSYYWKEISAPQGYKLDNQKHAFEVSYNNQNTQIEVANETVEEDVITGEFELTKITTNGSDSEVTQPEQNAVFGVVLKKYVDQAKKFTKAKIQNRRKTSTQMQYEADSNSPYSLNNINNSRISRIDQGFLQSERISKNNSINQAAMKKYVINKKVTSLKNSRLTTQTINNFSQKAVESIKKITPIITNCLTGILPLILVITLFTGTFAFLSYDNTTIPGYTSLSKEVLAYEETITKYCRKYNIEDYVVVIEAIMMHESGGKGNDPMQSSECPFNKKYPQTPNSISNPDYSIEVGIQYFKECLKQSEAKDISDTKGLSLALQGYNYGNDYIKWSIDNFGGYSEANAKVYSDQMKQKLNTSTYGDPYYVSHVFQYIPLGIGNVRSNPNFNNLEAWVSKNPYAQAGLYGQCTWFAWGRFYEIYGYSPGFTGDGWKCAHQLVNTHPDKFKLSEKPAVGAIFSTKGHNHVGIVIGWDGKNVTIQEGNLDGKTNTFAQAKKDWQTLSMPLDTFISMHSGVVFANPK